VINRATEILGNLENDAYGRDGLPRLSRSGGAVRQGTNAQTSLFPMMQPETSPVSREPDDPAASEVLATLRAKNPEEMTPMEALLLLDELCRRLK
jgi:DNA mismatch repair ATPase MutS